MAETTSREPTALERMHRAQFNAKQARIDAENHERDLAALSEGTNANIDNMVVRLLPAGTVCIGFPPQGQEFVLSERQFLGLMGWGRKHVGEGPHGKKK